ncbi:hypothetical protein [Halobaculum lipolyticum]|uniref:DUF8106 domain-containing protein n=1 Tax=Halobaculum lipolyticum TaxID=3032001 RepID=A0ABD5WGZ6_9EURY|nr:hypothetical protein [Halobaculum sp. DT31]
MDTPSTRTSRPPPKDTLFCPECGHAAPAGGDWVVEERPHCETLTCPDCDATVTVRGRHRPVPA